MTIKFVLVTLKLVLIIFNCAYFTGIIWILFVDIYEQIVDKDEYEEKIEEVVNELLAVTDEHGEDTFIDAYNIYHYPKMHQMIIPMYYAFTSLSTVGFGDYHPKSNAERIFCTIILLFGVMIFSYIMGVFIEMIESAKQKNQDLGDED